MLLPPHSLHWLRRRPCSQAARSLPSHSSLLAPAALTTVLLAVVADAFAAALLAPAALLTVLADAFAAAVFALAALPPVRTGQ